MSAAAKGPRRPLRNDLGSLAPAFLVVALCALALPRAEFVRIRDGVAAGETRAVCQFVRLSDAAREKALRKIRANLSVDPRGVRALRCDLSLSTVAESALTDPVDCAARARLRFDPAPEWSEPPWPPSAAAEPGAPLPAAAPAPERPPAFPRAEMLEMERFDRL